MTAPRPRLVIFDVDGTLVDSQDHIHAAMVAAFDAEGLIAPPRAEVLAIVGLSLPEAVSQLVPGLVESRRDRIVAAYKASFAPLRGAARAPLYPGARETLLALRTRGDVALGIATGKSRRGLAHLLAAHDLAGLFVTMQVADDHPSKPHPSMVVAALEETGVAAADAVMVGDTTYDMAMARAAGVEALGVGWGYHAAADLTRAGASEVLGAYDGLLPALDRIWRLA